MTTTTPDPGSPLPAGPVPPHSLDAEESVIGAMMLSSRAIEAVAETDLAAADFYRASHARVYQAILGLYGRGEPADAITVVAELDRTGHLEEALGAERVHELAALVPAASNAAHYARIVSESATRRALIRAGNDVAKIGFDGQGNAPEMLERAEQVVFEVSQHGHRSDLVSAREAVPAAFARIQELSESGRDIVGLPTGFHDLDRMTSGFHPGNLVVLAARPSMGKSGLAFGILVNVALAGQPVALFTLEMSIDEVMQRMLSLDGKVDSQRVRNGRGLNQDDWGRLLASSGRLSDAPIYVDDSGVITVGEIRSKVRRLKTRHPNLGLVAVDYLQLMTSASGSEENRAQQVAAISRSLKVLAREVGVPVLALSQLNRGVENRHDKRPMLQDLRESGAIEQDADLVAFIYRDEYYNPDEIDNAGIAELIIAKQRNGPTGTVKLHFKKEHARFGDLAHDRDYATV